MDPFKKLPAELQVEIMVQIRFRRTHLQFIQASPVMLQQYITSKHTISRKVLALDLDDEMVQDAIAIVLFPSQLESGELEISPLRLCRSWAAQKLPNPLRKHNDRLIGKLHKLHGRLILFIEDYITKATAVFPPREYICLPDLSPTGGQLMFKDRKLKGSTGFDAANLTCLERRLLLRAFLRYQLMSLINRQRLKIKGKWKKKLHQYKGKRFSTLDREGILCVRTYLESLYGAIFAQASDSWLPTSFLDPAPALNPGLLYPDKFFVNPNDYISDFGGGYEYSSPASSLAGFGFDLVTILIRYATAGSRGRYQLDQWLIRKRPGKGSEFYWTWSECNPMYETSIQGMDVNEDDYTKSYGVTVESDLEEEEKSQFESSAKNDHLIERSMKKEDRLEHALYRMLCSGIFETSRTQKAIFRQRAWVFFDDSRLYPSSNAKSHLPTWREFEEEQRNGQEFNETWLPELERARRRRRLQMWLHRQNAKSSGRRKVEESQETELEKELNVRLPRVTDNRVLWIPCPFWH